MATLDKPSPPSRVTIPSLVADKIRPHALQLLYSAARFVEEECIPAEPLYAAQLAAQTTPFSSIPPIMSSLKSRARSLGLWNLFLSKAHYPSHGVDLTNVEYALIAEWTGRCQLAAEAMNVGAPDSGNMEVLAKYGTAAQQEQWLHPLLAGEIRSAFLMTERQVASSDARNISLRMDLDAGKNEYVLNGSKWWSSGAGDPRCAIYLVMGKTAPSHQDAYKQQSVLLVPAGTPGITVQRLLSVYGYDDAPHGHAEITFCDVRVPASALLLGPGRGFEIIQGRLGPGRIHHAMRSIGAGERALGLMIARGSDPARKPSGVQLSEQSSVQQAVATSRLEIDAARLLVLAAACKIDAHGAKGAIREIAEAKVAAPNMALRVIDRAVQVWGAAGVGQDTPLAGMWAQQRTLRLADGPDEVHLGQMGRNELRRGGEERGVLERQRRRSEGLFGEWRVERPRHML